MGKSKAVSNKNLGDRLSNRNLLCFSLGGIGRDMSYNLFTFSLLLCIMYTKNITTAQFNTISIMIIICRIWDALNDPIMGDIVEKTKSKFGKFKPWILIGALSNAVILFWVFATKLRGEQFVIFFPFAYILWDLTYTMNDIGYWAMMPALTTNDHDRNRLSTWAVVCAGIGAGLASVGVPIFTTGDLAIGGNAVSGYTYVTLIICICFIACTLLTVFGVKEKPRQQIMQPKKESVGLKRMFKVIFGNDQLIWISVVMLLFNLGSNILMAMMTNYIYFEFGYEGTKASLFTIISGVAGAVILLYPWLAKKLDRNTILKFSIITSVLGYILMLMTGLIWPMNFYVLAGVGMLVFIGQTLFYMVITVSIANTVEYNEWKTGSRDEGIIFSLRPFMAKLASALQMLVVMIVYNILGVADITNAISNIENTTEMKIAQANNNAALIEQLKANKTSEIQAIVDNIPDITNFWLRFCMTILPIIFLVLSYIIMRRKFKIDENMYNKMLKDIEERKKENETENSTDLNVA